MIRQNLTVRLPLGVIVIFRKLFFNLKLTADNLSLYRNLLGTYVICKIRFSESRSFKVGSSGVMIHRVHGGDDDDMFYMDLE